MTDVFRKEYKPLGVEANQLVEDIKTTAQRLYDFYGLAESVGTAGDDIQVARRRLEESVMWAVKAVTA